MPVGQRDLDRTIGIRSSEGGRSGFGPCKPPSWPPEPQAAGGQRSASGPTAAGGEEVGALIPPGDELLSPCRDVRPSSLVNSQVRNPRFHLDDICRSPAIIRLWDNAWTEFIPFLDYDVEIRRVLLFDERDRVTQRPLSARRPGSRPLPDRTGRTGVSLPGHQIDPTRRGRHDGPCGGSRPSTQPGLSV